MSLLMDALRKAEDAKRRAEAGTDSVPPAELALEPLNPPPSPHKPTPPQASRLPDLAEHSAALDAGLSAIASEPQSGASTAAPHTRTPPRRDDAAERAAARNVFAAKTPAPVRRNAWPLIMAFAFVAALAIGVYFWWQLQSPSIHPRPTPMPQAAAPVATAPAAAPSSLPPPAALPTPPAPAPEETPASAARPTPPKPRLAAPPASTAAVAAAPVAARQRAARAEDAPPAEQGADTALRLRKTRPAAQNTVEAAFDALQAGRLDEAQRAYEQVLRGDSRSTDALLGLATIATRQGRHDLAQGYYLRALEADPANPTAQAGLINGRGQSDPGASESRLKGALDAQPESSALLFALGNLYARQARWSEAQQAYFRAYAAEPENADIIFNLAVALDHLRQNKLAAQYYQMALGAARATGNATLFDREQVRARIQELRP